MLTRVGDDALEAAVPSQARGHRGEVRVILDDQERVPRLDVLAVVQDLFVLAAGGAISVSASAGALRARPRPPSAGPMLLSGRYRVKVLPLPGRAVQADLATEQVRQLAADRKAEAGAAVLAAVPASACWKASKMIFCFSGGMPIPVSLTAKSTTVVPFESTCGPALLPPLGDAGAQHHVAVLRELERIRQ